MKLLLHDYSGHPFQAQLSRELARRGHTVHHVHCASYVSGKGRLERAAGDPEALTFTALHLGETFDKYSPWRRLAQERSYAKKFAAVATADPPDLVLTCNVPLLAHSLIKRRLMAQQIPTAFWHQDVYSHAIGLEARRRFGPLGALLARPAERIESWIARNASAVVAISEHFVPVHQRWGTDPNRLHVIPNWAPLDEIIPRPRENPWSEKHGLVGVPVMLYSGTLGLKHDALQLIELLRHVRMELGDARLVVISAGPAADQLRNMRAPGLLVLPFQPFSELSDVLSSADLLITILEDHASDYSVPSKTLTYLCAGRPVLAVVPAANPAFTVVQRSGGLAIDPCDSDLSVIARQVVELLADRDEVLHRGGLAREYAEAAFDIVRLADRFELALGIASAKDSAIPDRHAEGSAGGLERSEVDSG